MKNFKKIFEWIKVSGRFQHIVGSLLIVFLFITLSTMLISKNTVGIIVQSAIVTAIGSLCLEFKNKQYGKVFNFTNVFTDFLGYGLAVLLYILLLIII